MPQIAMHSTVATRRDAPATLAHAVRYQRGARGDCVEGADDSNAHGAVVRAMKTYLEAHCTRVVTLAELARLTGFSPFHVCRLFRDATGVPPYAYLMRARLDRARGLIVAGEPLSTVAYATGFSDQSHLTRHFKRAFGVTPGRYAQRGVTVASASRRRAS